MSKLGKAESEAIVFYQEKMRGKGERTTGIEEIERINGLNFMIVIIK
jgi:hypothetical protein